MQVKHDTNIYSDEQLTNVSDPNPPRSEIIWSQDPDPDPSLSHTKIRHMFKNALKFKIRHNFIHNS